jgi:transposase
MNIRIRGLTSLPSSSLLRSTAVRMMKLYRKNTTVRFEVMFFFVELQKGASPNSILERDRNKLYKAFDQYSFISYLGELKRRFHKLILFLDRAPPQHCRSKKVKAYLERNSDTTIVEYLPKGSPDLSAVEQCWRQGKSDLLVSKYYPKFTNLKTAIRSYYRTKHF